MTRRLIFNLSLLLLAAVPAVLSVASGARAEDKPKEIRLGFPSVGVGNRPIATGSALATAHLRGSLEEEFKKDGIEIKWNFLPGAGPAVNELYANGLLDFSTLGDLPSIIGRASGLQYRVLAGASVRGHIYVSVPADSPVQSIKQAVARRPHHRGRLARPDRVAVAAARALRRAGLRR